MDRGLTALLPDPRDLRIPLTSGALWLLFLWLAFSESITDLANREEIKDPFKGLGDILGSITVGVLLVVAAFLFGSAIQELLRFIVFWHRDYQPRMMTMYARALALAVHRLRKGAFPDDYAVRQILRHEAREWHAIWEEATGFKSLAGHRPPSPRVRELLGERTLGILETYEVAIQKAETEAAFRWTAAPPIAAIIVWFGYQTSWTVLFGLLVPFFLLIQGGRYWNAARQDVAGARNLLDHWMRKASSL